jgi:lipoprotein-anchoring transpeptidase ErfK/SrfK
VTGRDGSVTGGGDPLSAALSGGGGGRGRFVAIAALIAAGAVIGAIVLVVMTSSASLAADSSSLAKIGLPAGGGTIDSVKVYSPLGRSIPVDVRNGKIWPRRLIPAHERVSIDVVVKRPGWDAWLGGSEDKLSLQLTTPATRLRQHYLTLKAGAPLTLRFATSVQSISYGPAGQLRRRVLASPASEVTIARPTEAGSIEVAAAPRAWESAKAAVISWFPAGSAASAVASPTPGTTIQPATPITLTFSKPIRQALGSAMPPVTPATQGKWLAVNSHTIIFKPEGYGYGLSTSVTVALQKGVQLVGGHTTGTASAASWPVPAGSMLRAQQILAQLGYLPLDWKPGGAAVAPDPAAQEAAAISPPVGHFGWRYSNVPSSLRGFWGPGSSGIVTRGALMAFENDHGLTADGVAGPAVWKALINASAQGRRSTFGYTYVTVSTGSQSISVWHSGKTVLTGPVNTGISSQPTASGTYPVFEHIASGTMSGSNPDGSHYDDPGIQFISYFNGGDALHAFNRAQYGFPQSLGCVEMPTGEAGSVYPYTPIGTLVHVA